MAKKQERLASLRANIFPAAHAAIEDWATFPWHRYAHSPKSSQALALDVFGTLSAARPKARDDICADIARKASLPAEGPWQVTLEWHDADRLLKEPSPTQVDAVATSPNTMMLFECKFTEAGGTCSQVQPKSWAPPACNGLHELQANPQNGKQARCALSAKGIRYWDWIEKVYNLPKDADYAPCPFALDAYQWMRNTVLAAALRKHHSKAARVVAVYADGPSFQTAQKVRSGLLGHETKHEADAILSLSYQAILKAAQKIDPSGPWADLSVWVQRKIDCYAGVTT